MTMMGEPKTHRGTHGEGKVSTAQERRRLAGCSAAGSAASSLRPAPASGRRNSRRGRRRYGGRVPVVDVGGDDVFVTGIGMLVLVTAGGVAVVVVGGGG